MTAELFRTHPEWRRFIASLRKRKAQLRPGIKETVNTETFKTRQLFTVEMQISPRRWLPIKFPFSFGDFWYFPDEKMRDLFLEAYEEAA